MIITYWKELLLALLLGFVLGLVVAFCIGGTGADAPPVTVAPEITPELKIDGIISQLTAMQTTLTKIETKVNTNSQGGLININRNPKGKDQTVEEHGSD